MDIKLTPLELRVIACLLEKQISTPEQYPLSLNALTLACNQKSNRDPVMQLDESEVQQTLDALARKYLVSEKSGFGSRVTKYQHRFCNTEMGSLKFSEQERGIICELLLRGPQTPGELRSRTARLCKFNDVQEVEATLQQLMEREDGPFVVRLAREPGKRESRYAHLFGDVDVEEMSRHAASAAEAERAEPGEERITELERQVAELRAELAQIKSQLAQLQGGV